MNKTMSASITEVGTIDFTITPSTDDPATLQAIRDELDEYGDFTDDDWGTIELEDGRVFEWRCCKYMDGESFSWDETSDIA